MARYESTGWSGFAGPVRGLIMFAIAIVLAHASLAWLARRMFLGIALNIVFQRVVGEARAIALTPPPSLVGFGAAGFRRGLR